MIGLKSPMIIYHLPVLFQEEKNWSIHSDVIPNKFPFLHVVVILNCLLNNLFAVELLQNNDSFVNIVNDRAVTNKDNFDIPQNKDVDITSEYNNQSWVPVKVPLNKVYTQFVNMKQ